MLMKWEDLEIGDKVILTEDMYQKYTEWVRERSGQLTIINLNLNKYRHLIEIEFVAENGAHGRFFIDIDGKYHGTPAFEIVELKEE